MKTTDTNSYTTHREVTLLLPWFVNKTLKGSELELVENHLKVCLPCRRELIAMQKLSVAINEQKSIDSAALAGFSNLLNRIKNTETSADSVTEIISHSKEKQKIFDRKPPVFNQSRLAKAAVVLLAITIPAYLGYDILYQNDYRTLSDAETGKFDNGVIRVIFSKNTTQQQINAMLVKIHGQIISGPSDESVYNVQIRKLSNENQLLNALDQLRKNTNVLFAEPAYPLLSSNQKG